jgi:hypothetical protein
MTTTAHTSSASARARAARDQNAREGKKPQVRSEFGPEQPKLDLIGSDVAVFRRDPSIHSFIHCSGQELPVAVGGLLIIKYLRVIISVCMYVPG